MITYDFDKPINRRGTNSYKWDLMKDGVLPMWVADMDFKTAPNIKKALQERVEHGVFGYTNVPESYYDAIINWQLHRHKWNIKRDWILYTSGVVPAISCALKAITMPGEKVLVQTPVYNCFFSSIKNNGCEVLENSLVRESDTYKIDFTDFENKCADEKTTVFLLCNPHNPSGRVWTKEELQKMNDICMKHSVKIISDEIHCELTMPDYEFTPFASISEECLRNSIILNSASKAFNTAGLQNAYIICENQEWRRRIDRAININELCDVNPFGVIALQAAYNESEEWLDALRLYIADNYKALKKFMLAELPKLEVIKLEGTYLVWIDISALEFTSDELTERLAAEAKVCVNSGTMYGNKDGQGYIRMNIACPRATMMEGLKRISKNIGEYMIDDYSLGCPE